MIDKEKTMIRINIEKIKKLRNYLDDTCYDTLNQKIRQHQNYFFNPLPNEYDNIQLELLKLKKDKRVLLKLLLLGDKIELNEIENTIGTEFLNLLIELGIVIKSDGYVQTDSYIIISFLDKYFLVGLPYNNPNCRIKDPSVYIGMDTYRLTENITSKRVDKVLDLCAGSGIQGICAANKANSVTLVEINHKTIPFTKFNIVLNNVEDKVRVKEGSLYENLGNTTFDEIYVNPPFIAVPQDWNFPIAGNGGENGLEITLNIIRGYKRHLNINGRAYMVGEAIGTEKEPFLIDELRKELGNDFKITVILDFKFSIEAHLRRSSYVAINMGKMNGKNADELFEKYKDWIKKVNATSVYNYYLKVERTQPAQGSIEVINMTTTWSKDDVPVLKNNKDFQIQKFPQYYAICRNGKIIAQLDDATLTFIKKIDGKLTIEEIYQKLCEENKNVANYLPRVEAIESLAEACGTLKARNIIEKCNRN